jgi:putative transposase
MKKTRYSESQIIKILKEVEGGRTVKAVCREYGIAEATVLQLEEYIRRYGSVRYQTAQRVRRGK